MHMDHNKSRLTADVHREARKAFLALATEEAKYDIVDSEAVKVDYDNIIALPNDEKIRPSESTPVRAFTCPIRHIICLCFGIILRICVLAE